MATTARVRCRESRLVADDKYIAGRDYDIDPERAGKYHDYFVAANPDEQAKIDAAWGARMAEETRRKELVTSLTTFDPSILAAAARLIQAEAGKRLAVKES